MESVQLFNWDKKNQKILFLLTFLFVVIFFFFLDQLSKSNNLSQVTTTTPSQTLVGTNLSGIADWSTEIPFLDSFKFSRKWITQCDAKEPGCKGLWDTNEYEKLDLDKYGWVKSLPTPEDPPEYTRVGTLMFREIGRYLGGKYIVLYEGEGTIEYKFDAHKDEAKSTPGRDVINVTPSNNGIYLIITSTDPKKTGNYIRNIHVVPAKYEKSYKSEIFNSQFIQKIRPFKALRFMDWMGTNNSEQKEWSNRPVVEKSTYSYGGGTPLEIMVQLANRIGADPWFNMPHMATDEYITNFAKIVKKNIRPKAKIYVEYSNEVWNPQFKQFHWVKEQSVTEWGKEAPFQWHGKRTAQMCDIWKNVFGSDRNRVVCVLGTHTGYPDAGRQALDCPLWSQAPCYKHGIDAFGITRYFGGHIGKADYQSKVQSWLKEPDGGFNQLFSELFKDVNESSFLNQKGVDAKNLRLAQERGVKLLVYEGGQHLVGINELVNNQALTDFLISANRNPKMYEVYTKVLNQWKNEIGGLFMNFTDIGQPSKWGSWGALEHVDQKSSPKYDALINFINQNS